MEVDEDQGMQVGGDRARARVTGRRLQGEYQSSSLQAAGERSVVVERTSLEGDNLRQVPDGLNRYA